MTHAKLSGSLGLTLGYGQAWVLTSMASKHVVSFRSKPKPADPKGAHHTTRHGSDNKNRPSKHDSGVWTPATLFLFFAAEPRCIHEWKHTKPAERSTRRSKAVEADHHRKRAKHWAVFHTAAAEAAVACFTRLQSCHTVHMRHEQMTRPPWSKKRDNDKPHTASHDVDCMRATICRPGGNLEPSAAMCKVPWAESPQAFRLLPAAGGSLQGAAKTSTLRANNLPLACLVTDDHSSERMFDQSFGRLIKQH